MSGEGATFNYKFGQKNNWRRTAWNQIVDRLTVHPRDAVVLYLAGEEDLDRPVALSKGFRAHNLLAIEKDKRVTASLRSRGTLTINDDAMEVLKAWPIDRQINVVWMDLCAGLIRSVSSGLNVAQVHPAFRNTAAFMINLQRGREVNSVAIKYGASLLGGDKHRGRIYFFGMLEMLATNGGRISRSEPRVEYAKGRMLATSKPEFFSYKSSAVMDSAIFTSPARVISQECFSSSDPYAGHSARKKIAPILALRQMKINRTGPYSK